MKKSLLAVVAAILTASVLPAHAQVRITEVVPWSSSSAVGADWFELTNTGAVALDITGWTMDDDSNNPNSALLSGITSIAPGESVIFLELAGGGNATTLTNLFISTWFGGSAPAGLHIGTYTQGVAGGVGLGAGGDAVNVFNGTAGTLQAKVTFGASDSVNPLQTFDNAAGLNNTTISQLSVVGTNGAFVAANDVNQIGSPGAIPEPQTYAMMLVGLTLLVALTRKRRA